MAYYGAQRPGEAGETDGSRGECVLIREWIERLLPTLSERNQGANSIVQSLCACNDARSEISTLAIGFGWERQTAAV